MRPYYEDNSVTLYHGDCREFLPRLDATVTATMVTDPPYGMGYKSGWSGGSVEGDADASLRDEVLTMWQPRPALVFGRWSVPRPLGTRIRLVWDKGRWPGMGDLQMPWGQSDEEVYVIGHGFTGRRMGTILWCDRLGAAEMSHPTEKPVPVLEMLIERCPRGVIVDPFAGAGTTLVAAKNLGRMAWGVEVEEKYCERIAERLSQEVLGLGDVA